MRNMSKVFTEAHRITREIKAQYPEVDYRTQFGLSLSYLLNKKEEEKMEGKKRLPLGKVHKETRSRMMGTKVFYDGVITIEHETEKAILVQFVGTITDIWYDGEELVEKRETQVWIPKSISVVTENAIYIDRWKKLGHCMEQVAE